MIIGSSDEADSPHNIMTVTGLAGVSAGSEMGAGNSSH